MDSIGCKECCANTNVLTYLMTGCVVCDDRQAALKECPPEGDATCYCIPLGDCFTRVQEVDIDHCNFDLHKSNQLQIQYSVTNQAGLVRPGVIDVSP